MSKQKVMSLLKAFDYKLRSTKVRRRDRRHAWRTAHSGPVPLPTRMAFRHLLRFRRHVNKTAATVGIRTQLVVIVDPTDKTLDADEAQLRPWTSKIKLQ